ncbi:MAG: hypothetical protein MJ116_04350, partial [Lachnospiraceae bacterium]|nr:hypothetical protein [Lachnospiraceae bacterium]
RTPAFQAGYVGSIPITCFFAARNLKKCEIKKAEMRWMHLSFLLFSRCKGHRLCDSRPSS